jgi:hypothetical protein
VEKEEGRKKENTHCSTLGLHSSKSSSVPAATPTMSSSSGVKANRLLPHSLQNLRVRGWPESVEVSM